MENNNQSQSQQSTYQPDQSVPISSASLQNNLPSPKSKLPLILIVLILLTLTIGGGTYYYLGIKNKINQEDKPCPAIARICNDGTTAKLGTNCAQTCPEDSISPTPITQPSPVPDNIPDDITSPAQIGANWKTYTNKNFNFEFKYPNNFVVTDNLPAQKVTFTKATENLVLSDQASGIELKFWFEPAGFGDIFADKIIDIDYSTDKGISILEETIEDVKQYRDDNKTIIMNSAKPINNHAITITYSYQKGDKNKENLLKEILSTFKFTDQIRTSQSLKPADTDSPAAGICEGPTNSNIVEITINMDTPPRCMVVSSNQQLKVINNTDKTITVNLSRYSLTINPGKSDLITDSFGSYLELGVHSLKSSPYGGPELWLK